MLQSAQKKTNSNASVNTTDRAARNAMECGAPKYSLDLHKKQMEK
jgi:hypothetical protein